MSTVTDRNSATWALCMIAALAATGCQTESRLRPNAIDAFSVKRSSQSDVAPSAAPTAVAKQVRYAASTEDRPTEIRTASFQTLDIPSPSLDDGDRKSHTASSYVEEATGVRDIDLATSLELVAGQNPQVGYVQQRVAEASAQLDAAEALWLPSIRGGANYNKHEGSFQDVGGRVFNVSRGSVYTGFGARAVGASSPAVPGLSAQFHLADAIFQPLIASRTVSARQWASSAKTNDLLLQAALAHLDLQQAVERHAIATTTRNDLQKLATLTASFAKQGQGNQADADRAQTELDLQQNVVTRAVESVRVSSARLVELLSLDDGLELRPAVSAIVRMELVSTNVDVQSLVGTAIAERPEMSAGHMEVAAASERYRREKYSPFIPHVGAAVSYGGLGGGTGATITHYRDRFDADIWAYWEVRNFGIGERAARNAAQSRFHQAQYQRDEVMNRIRREVTSSHAQALSASDQIQQAETSVKSAKSSYQRNDQRIRNGQGLPLEVLQSIRALDAARREQLDARAASNRAQFRLHYSLGWLANP